jgi:hypothetical protein
MKTTEDVLEVVETMYADLQKIKSDINFFEASNAFKQNILAIEIALALFQLGYFTKRPIEEYERRWFEGGYYIHYDLDGGWPDLANNYSSIVEMVKENNFFSNEKV